MTEEEPAEGILGLKTYEMTYGDRDYKADGGKIHHLSVKDLAELHCFTMEKDRDYPFIKISGQKENGKKEMGRFPAMFFSLNTWDEAMKYYRWLDGGTLMFERLPLDKSNGQTKWNTESCDYKYHLIERKGFRKQYRNKGKFT